jgi:hypothetical protein
VRPLVVELAGPAGAGKTTLARALVVDSPATTTGVQVGPLSLAAGLGSAVPRLAAARLSAPGRWWTRDELRSLAYLRAWRHAVGDGDGDGDGVGLLVLDHGPVFRLASLAAFGPPMAASPAFAALRAGLAEDWGRLLHAVVWLDAPDEVLLRRIDGRTQQHRIQHVDHTEGARFLARYREAYRTTLALVADAGARVVEVDTTARTPAELAADLRATLRVPSPRLPT